MVVNPNSSPARIAYLTDKSDYSLLITSKGTTTRNGGKYLNERLLWYTSGTTGDSKFCSFTQSQVDILAKKICQTYDISNNDRYTSVMPLWHAHGQGFYWATQLANCEVNFADIKQIRSLNKFDPTFVTAIPDVLRVLGELKFSSLRFVRSASAPLPATVYHALKHKFNVPIIEAFGMTEALSHCFTNPLNGEQRIGTIGLPDGIEADIVDGKLFIKGTTVCATNWYDTGDLADQDSAGYYRILGRSKDQLNIRGIKLNPISIEQQLLNAVPELTECVIFGVDRIKCIYVGNCEPATITKFLNSIGSYCRPVLVKSVASIPLSPSGKISRNFLNSEFD
jgi:acyl-coenzyme A synthetase/AMP-(fatty) acid ligase